MESSVDNVVKIGTLLNSEDPVVLSVRAQHWLFLTLPFMNFTP